MPVAQAAPVPEPVGETASPDDEGDELRRDLALFHARIADALDAAVERLRGDVVAEILGRELLLQPCDIARIVVRALDRYAHAQPLRVRAHPAECALLADLMVPVVADEALRRGDAVIDVRDGSLDVTLGARVEMLLAYTAS